MWFLTEPETGTLWVLNVTLNVGYIQNLNVLQIKQHYKS